MRGRYNRANAGPIQASTSTFVMVCPVYWLSTVCTVAGTNGTRQYNASIGPILVCLLGPDSVSGPLTVNSPLRTRGKQDQSFSRIILFVFAVNGIFPIPRSHRSLVPLNGENIGLYMYLD